LCFEKDLGLSQSAKFFMDGRDRAWQGSSFRWSLAAACGTDTGDAV